MLESLCLAGPAELGGVNWMSGSVFNPQMLEEEVNLLKLAQRFSGAQRVTKYMNRRRWEIRFL